MTDAARLHFIKTSYDGNTVSAIFVDANAVDVENFKRAQMMQKGATLTAAFNEERRRAGVYKLTEEQVVKRLQDLEGENKAQFERALECIHIRERQLALDTEATQQMAQRIQI
jgi:hypothetical protein